MKQYLLLALCCASWAHADTIIKQIRNHTNTPLQVGSYTPNSCFIPQQSIPAHASMHRTVFLSGPIQATGKIVIRTADASRQLIVDDTQNNKGCCGAWRVVLTDGKTHKSTCLQPQLFRYTYVAIDVYENDCMITQAP
jgi:hypothetical protein